MPKKNEWVALLLVFAASFYRITIVILHGDYLYEMSFIEALLFAAVALGLVMFVLRVTIPFRFDDAQEEVPYEGYFYLDSPDNMGQNLKEWSKLIAHKPDLKSSLEDAFRAALLSHRMLDMTYSDEVDVFEPAEQVLVVGRGLAKAQVTFKIVGDELYLAWRVSAQGDISGIRQLFWGGVILFFIVSPVVLAFPFSRYFFGPADIMEFIPFALKSSGEALLLWGSVIVILGLFFRGDVHGLLRNSLDAEDLEDADLLSLFVQKSMLAAAQKVGIDL